MDRGRIVGGRRPGLVTDLLYVTRPRDREGLLTPNLFEQGAVWPLRGAVHCTGDIGQAHFDGIGRWPLRLLGRRITQSAAGRPHVPEIATDEIALAGIVMQNWRKRCVGMRLRLAVAEPRAHRTGIGSRHSSDTGPVNPVSGVWQKAQVSLRFTDRCLSYSISLPSSSICWT